MNDVIRLDNRLIQQPEFGNFNFKLREWRVLMQLLARVRKGDAKDTVYSVHMRDLCEWLGLNIENRRATVTDVKKVLKSISDQSTWATLTTGKNGLVRMIGDPTIEKNSSVVTFRIPANAAQFLTNMREYESRSDDIIPYTCVEPDTFNSLSTALACKLYLFFKSYRTIPGHKFSMNENKIRQLVFGDKVKKGYHTGKILCMIEKALEDISENTDIAVTMDVRQNGRELEFCQFTISETEDAIIFIEKKIPPRRFDLEGKLFKIASRIEKAKNTDDLYAIIKEFGEYSFDMAAARRGRDRVETPENPAY